MANRLLATIEAEADAADRLTAACTRRVYIEPDEEGLPPGVIPFRRAFRTALITPTDMVATLGKLK